MQALRLREYDTVAISHSGKAHYTENGLLLPREDFAALKALCLEGGAGEESLSAIFKPTLWNRKEALQAQNYVGVVALPSTTVIEILPKISDAVENEQELRCILIKILQSLPEYPFRTFKQASLQSGELPLLEVFIRCFLQEVSHIIRCGIASDYVSIEENSSFLRGKLLVHEHIRQNAVRRERFYVCRDEFLTDMAENRLVKSALLAVGKLSKNFENLRMLKLQLNAFEDIPESSSFAKDRVCCRHDRNLLHYQRALMWCDLLLCNKTPVPTAGKTECLAVLFPMEKLFERYVAHKLRERLTSKGWIVKEQAGGYYLVDLYDKVPFYELRPDLLFQSKNMMVIADTKWKKVSSVKDIKSQGDLYQLFAYNEKCLPLESNCQRGPSFLIYPKTEYFPHTIQPFLFNKNSSLLHAVAYDLKIDECPIVEHLEALHEEHFCSQ